MYKQNKPNITKLRVNTSYIGETLEQKIKRIVHNKEPIKDGAPLIYTNRKEGVKPQYDIRTDRWEIALEAMDYVAKSHKAKRETNPDIGKQAQEGMKKEDGGTPANTSDKQ